MIHGVDLEVGRDPEGVRAVLGSLPEWFGIPESAEEYVADAASERYSSLLVRRAGRTVGVALVHERFPASAELHLLAVHRDARHQGIGRALVQRVAADEAAAGRELLSVHTVGPSHDDANYAETRAFYAAVGFLPLEEHRGLGWDGPMLIMVKKLQAASAVQERVGGSGGAAGSRPEGPTGS